MWREVFSPFSYASLTTVLLIASLHIAGAQVMQSTNYSIQSDSINFAGGLSTSTNYTLESTAGELASGFSSSSNYSLKAGYQQMQGVYIAMTSAANVTMSPSIPGVTGGTANGSTSVIVTTDSLAGYELRIESTATPAMQKGGDSIADYAPVGVDPDFTFTTGSADAHFGYSVEGSDTVQRFKDDGASCNTGSSNAAFTCWDGLSMTPQTIASQAGSNHPNGATTTVYFRVGVGGSVVQPAGVYTATTTLTALSL